MKQKFSFSFFAWLLLMYATLSGATGFNEGGLTISLQQMIPSEEDAGAYVLVNEMEEWSPGETAVIICDMWDSHWAGSVAERIAEIAPHVNKVVAAAREKGVLVVHAPGGSMEHYKDHPARKLAMRYKDTSVKRRLDNGMLELERNAVWPLEQTDEGSDTQTKSVAESPRVKQTDLIEIAERDAISDSMLEIAGLFKKRGIKNVIVMGVHTNLGMMDRSYGLRNLVRLGYNVVLMRDLTDTLYDPDPDNRLSHFTGNSLMTAYIEKYVCPTMVSSDFTGEKQFRFRDDSRPIVAFISAEGEYRSNQRFPEFVHNYLIKNNINCEFALGKAVMKGEGRHNIENLQILNDADLAVIAVRRRALEQEKMKLIKDFIDSGKPVLGIRVASHAFNANQDVPREGGGLTESGENPEFLEQWPGFDKEVIGGNYQGHHRRLAEGTDISIVPGMENHPILKGINPDGFGSPSWLYKNRPLYSEKIQVLLSGKIPDVPVEPVMWVNNRTQGKVVYTSLGHWDDWLLGDFNKLIVNSIYYLLEN